MGDRGNVNYARTGETTEWEDILISKGVVSKEQVYLAKGLDPRDFMEEYKQKVEIEEPEQKTPLETAKTIEELDELEDEFDDDRFFQDFREKRLAELKEQALRNRFGTVQEITKADWIKEVNEASAACWVIIHLYQTHVAECSVVDEAFLALSSKFRDVKFLKIRSNLAVENWPDSNLPAIFLYRNGSLQSQFIGVKSMGGTNMTPDDLEWHLAQKGVLETELEENPRNKAKNYEFLRGKGTQPSRYRDDDF